MTDRTKDGGPAFPSQSEMVEMCEDGTVKPWGYSGMSLREWFAGQALMGIVSGYWSNADMCGLSPSDIARDAYQQADAMLKARERS